MVILLFVFCLLIIGYLAMPWLVPDSGSAPLGNTRLKSLLQQKEKLLTTYEALELDYQTQKMSLDDFTSQKAALLSELQEVYKELDDVKLGFTGSEQRI